MANTKRQKKLAMIEEGRRIRTRQDFNKLVRFLLSERERGQLDDPTKELKKSATRTIMDLLWGKGKRSPQNIEKICRHISRNDEWDTSRKLPGKEPEDMKVLIKRLQRKVNRLKGKIGGSTWEQYAYIKYSPVGATYRLLTDPKEIEEDLKPKDNIKIDIEIKSRRHSDGIPVLKVGDPIRFHLASPIKGHLHLRHIDANGLVDVMFPLKKGSKKLLVTSGKIVEGPKNLLKEGFRWKVAKTSGKECGIQQIVAVVTREDVELKDSDLERFGIEIKKR